MRVREQMSLGEPSNRNGSGGGGDEVTTRNKSRSCSISYCGIAGIVAAFIFVATFTAILTYNFGICSNINVQSEVCDKKNVIPITIALNNSSTTEQNDTQYEEDLHLANRTNIRLPKTMHPISYELKLIPFLFEGNFTFEGDVRIKVNVTINCKNITLHAIGLKMNEVNVWKIQNATSILENRTQIDVIEQKVMAADQFFVIIFDVELEANFTYEIHIKYNGTLNENLQGFYRSSYEVNNTTRYEIQK